MASTQIQTEMSDRQTYPSPTVEASRPPAGPFYGNAHAEQNHEDDVPRLELHEEDKQEAQSHQDLLAELKHHINPELQHSMVQDPNIMAVHDGAQHIAREVMSLDEANHNAHYPPLPMDHTSQPATPGAPMPLSSKARTKVSRACDECRRKKIRCDATNENDTSSCTACKKSGYSCQFSRTPQKRGPSKGYIKELADRVSSLEGQIKYGETPIQPAMAHEDNQFILDNTFTAINAAPKRTHSMSEGLNDHYTASTRNGFPPQEPQELQEAQEQQTMHHTPQPVPEPTLSLRFDESLASLYYQSIHPFLPFLPNGGTPMLREEVNSLSQASKNALLATMEVTIRSVHYSGVADLPNQAHARADELVRAVTFNDRIGLAYLQSLLFLTVDAVNRGGAISQGGNGPRPSNYIVQAMQEARDMELYSFALIERTNDENEMALARSIAVCIAVLDALTANANRRPHSKLSVPAPITVPGDLSRINPRLFWIGRYCSFLVQLHTIDIESDAQSQDRADLRFGNLKISIEQRTNLLAHKRIMLSGIETIKEASNTDKDTLLSLMNWYIWGHIELYFWPIMESSNLFFCINRIVQLLETQQHQGVNPFTHHFAGFAAHVLFQLVDLADTREEAATSLAALGNTMNHITPHTDNQSYDAAIRDAVSKKHIQFAPEALPTSPTLGLQHLANAAVSTTSPIEAETTQPDPSQQPQPEPQPIINDGGVAAAAEAAAKAAQLQISSAAKKIFDPELISQEGYLYALLG